MNQDPNRALTIEQRAAFARLLVETEIFQEKLSRWAKVGIGLAVAGSLTLGLGIGVALFGPIILILWKFAFWIFA